MCGGSSEKRLTRPRFKISLSIRSWRSSWVTGEIDVCSIDVVTDDTVEVYYKKTSKDDLSAIDVNIFLTCFTACWTRLYLYEVVELLQELCLYFDTDCKVITSEPGQPNPPCDSWSRDSPPCARSSALRDQSLGSRLQPSHILEAALTRAPTIINYAAHLHIKTPLTSRYSANRFMLFNGQWGESIISDQPFAKTRQTLKFKQKQLKRFETGNNPKEASPPTINKRRN